MRDIGWRRLLLLVGRIVAIPDLRPVKTIDGTATNFDRQAGT
jgi:hypothetical protein